MINSPIKPKSPNAITSAKYGKSTKNVLLCEIEHLNNCLNFLKSDIDTFPSTQFCEIFAAADMIRAYINYDEFDRYIACRALDGLKTLCNQGVTYCNNLIEE